MAIWNAKVMKGLDPIISSDHPLSLGYKTYLVTRNRAFDKAVHCTQEQFEHCILQEERNFSAFHAVFDTPRVIVLAFCDHDREKNMTMSRLIELITHESSHLVDGLFERAKVSPCTETRSYYLDWVVGAVCKNIPILRSPL